MKQTISTTNLSNRYPLHRRHEHRDACGIGFIAEESGIPSRRVIDLSLKALSRLEHRGGKSFDRNTGDGAGILVDIPWSYYRDKYKTRLREKKHRQFALAVLFTRELEVSGLTAELKKISRRRDIDFLGLEAVPTDANFIGDLARVTEPDIHYAFFQLGEDQKYDAEQVCYLLRKDIEREFISRDLYFCSLSTKTMVLKGLLTSFQLPQFYKDLADPEFKTRMAIFHERYSTNTNPSWEMAQPLRGIAHNGEINTIKGNRLWMNARERQARSKFWGSDMEKLQPFITPERSDSTSFDEVFELLTKSGKHPWHTMMMLIPDSYNASHKMKQKLRDFYIYHENFMEPWDGPAAIIFTDGNRVGAKLDRNGLRPLRYSLTKSGLVVMASESGVVDIENQDLVVHHHMSSGEIFSVNLDGSGVHKNEEIKSEISSAVDYSDLLTRSFLRMERNSDEEQFGDFFLPPEGFDSRLRLAFGWHKEAVERFTKPLSEKPLEPVGAMGDDTPPAFISKKDRSFFDYFYQTFAQVTNPPVDPIRERSFMSLYHYLGSEENIFATKPKFHGAIRINSPVLSPHEVKSLMATHETFNHQVVSCLFNESQSMEARLSEIQKECVEAVENGCKILFLSDEHVAEDMLPIPSAVSLAAVHIELVRKKIRSNVSLICFSGDVYEDHHVAVLGALGASAV
ncbi:MAG: glutamate synthase subunit alpha, partial [Candidatus Marinimicrobia bacterium]|nr:glutamate synthase subunit alpha [Candidatus Neomarinimicrobiota bacterium]